MDGEIWLEKSGVLSCGEVGKVEFLVASASRSLARNPFRTSAGRYIERVGRTHSCCPPCTPSPPPTRLLLPTLSPQEQRHPRACTMAVIKVADGTSDPILTRLVAADTVPWYKKPNLRLMYLWLFLCCMGVEMTSGFDSQLINTLQFSQPFNQCAFYIPT